MVHITALGQSLCGNVTRRILVEGIDIDAQEIKRNSKMIPVTAHLAHPICHIASHLSHPISHTKRDSRLCLSTRMWTLTLFACVKLFAEQT